MTDPSARLLAGLVAEGRMSGDEAMPFLAAMNDAELTAPFWSRAGLTPRAERPGRAKNGSTLSAWWRQLGTLDLFEEAALGAGLPVVMVDTNVVSDWYGSPEVHRPTRVASQALLADNVQAEITIVLSPRVNIELDQIADKQERDRHRAAADHHVRVRSLTADEATTYNALVSPVASAQLEADPSLLEDRHQVADALDNSVQYFVTNDERCLALADQYLPTGSSLVVLRPHELIRRLEEQLQYPPFQSRFIESIDLQWVPAGSVPEQRLVDAFVSQEKNPCFRTAVSGAPGCSRRSSRRRRSGNRRGAARRPWGGSPFGRHRGPYPHALSRASRGAGTRRWRTGRVPGNGA